MIYYDPHDWWQHFLDIRGSMVREIFGRVAGVVVWSALVVVFYKFGNPIVGIPPTVHGLVGVALGLLLVFRTNASYDRFWEGRKAWGGIVNETAQPGPRRRREPGRRPHPARRGGAVDDRLGLRRQGAPAGHGRIWGRSRRNYRRRRSAACCRPITCRWPSPRGSPPRWPRPATAG